MNAPTCLLTTQRVQLAGEIHLSHTLLCQARLKDKETEVNHLQLSEMPLLSSIQGRPATANAICRYRWW
jgi:hypothetical protein